MLQVEGESLVIHEMWISTADFKILTDISLLGVALEPSKFIIFFLTIFSGTVLNEIFSSVI